MPTADQFINMSPTYRETPAQITTDQNQMFDDLLAPELKAFQGRSIAASGWMLEIPKVNVSAFLVDVNNIKDIEFIIAYRHSDRILRRDL